MAKIEGFTTNAVVQLNNLSPDNIYNLSSAV